VTDLFTKALTSRRYADLIETRNGHIEKYGFRLFECSSCGCEYQYPLDDGSGRSKPKTGRCLFCSVLREMYAAKAGGALTNAYIWRGLPRASTLKCLDCGAPAAAYDHRDYDKPLEVEPVFRKCNVKRGPGEPFRTRLRTKNNLPRPY
jgi:hypothetical protein